jgi:hypothetical protein
MEKGLDRSFAACIVALVAVVAAPLALQIVGSVLLVGCYLWFAASVGRAAKAVDSNVLLFVLWVLLAPLLSLIPIPIVSPILLASPLSLKFFLSSQLRSKIHAGTFEP